MDLTQLKTQVMTMMMVNTGTHSQQSSIYNMLYTMLLVNIIEYFFKGVPVVWKQVCDLSKDYFHKNKSAAITKFIPDSKTTDTVYAITLQRNYDKNDDNKCVEKVDSIIEYICNSQAITQIKLDKRYIINTKDEFQLTPQLRVKVNELLLNDKGEIASIQLTVFSTTWNVTQIREWIDEIHRNYCYEKNNKLGNRKFYFNEIPLPPQKQLDMNAIKNSKGVGPQPKYNWATAPKQLTFTMNEFKTSKSFNNVFGTHVNELKERLDLFVNHPEWYSQRGIPHSLGILLHGIPGAGKTSTIKAIARDTCRHIFNLSLREYTTQKQLVNLFFNENVAVIGDNGQQQTYTIPLNQRIYVIEDIDCLTNVVYDRGANTNMPVDNGEGVTLSFILNLLDGVLETPGRILVITSNYPERLDKALVRPGRIDVKINFTNASRQLIMDVINNFYNISIELDEVPAVLEGIISPAEVLESLCTYFKSHTAAIEHMCDKVKKMSVPIDMTQSVILPSKAIDDDTPHSNNASDTDTDTDTDKDTDNKSVDYREGLLNMLRHPNPNKDKNISFHQKAQQLAKDKKEIENNIKISKVNDIHSHNISLKSSYKPSEGSLIAEIFETSDLTTSGSSMLDELYNYKIT